MQMYLYSGSVSPHTQYVHLGGPGLRFHDREGVGDVLDDQ